MRQEIEDKGVDAMNGRELVVSLLLTSYTSDPVCCLTMLIQKVKTLIRACSDTEAKLWCARVDLKIIYS